MTVSFSVVGMRSANSCWSRKGYSRSEEIPAMVTAPEMRRSAAAIPPRPRPTSW